MIMASIPKQLAIVLTVKTDALPIQTAGLLNVEIAMTDAVGGKTVSVHWKTQEAKERPTLVDNNLLK